MLRPPSKELRSSAVKLWSLVAGKQEKSGMVSQPDEANSQIIEFCRFLAKEARKNEITVAIEPLNSKATNTVNTLLEGLKLVREVKQPEIKLLVDLFHLTEEDEPFDDIYRAQSELVHVHIPVPDIEGSKSLSQKISPQKILPVFKTDRLPGWNYGGGDNGGRFNNFATQVRPST